VGGEAAFGTDDVIPEVVDNCNRTPLFWAAGIHIRGL